MKKITIGILAHVDAGKTTLSEALLYLNGSIRKIGRVDSKDSFLDMNELERKRGITIFSKQAVFQTESTKYYLLDTPGHVDFSAEMERTLQVLDYAILVVNGVSGVQGHTRTLWKSLKQYNVPVFIFVNKMDQELADKDSIMSDIQNHLSKNCVDFCDENYLENVAACDEELLEKYFEDGVVEEDDVKRLIAMRKTVPCFFGSALRLDGVDSLIDSLDRYTLDKYYFNNKLMNESVSNSNTSNGTSKENSSDINYTNEFAARVYKITRDEQNNRLTHMKITAGSIKVKDLICEEKINQIRIYSGNKFETVNEVFAGDVCAVTGLTETKSGMALGSEREYKGTAFEPVLNYKLILPDNVNTIEMLSNMRILEDEEPELMVSWNEELKEINVKLMGQVQTEILKSVINERFGVDVKFGSGSIVYKETVEDVVEGVGHFEPLKHYAEVHLILEPLPRGTGTVFDCCCSEEALSKNWQRLIMTHLNEKEHRGVLTGGPITDIKITLVNGKSHLKHTEGGDFRQATYRAVRHGLMYANSVLLEPYYDFYLEIPAEMIGRAMSDVERMSGTFNPPEIDNDNATITGRCPVSTMHEYYLEVVSYTKGLGKLFCTFGGYDLCHNPDEVIDEIGYDPLADIENTPNSVFCSHGAGYGVNWDEVYDHMHLESSLSEEDSEEETDGFINEDLMSKKAFSDMAVEERELEEIFARTYGGINDSRNIFHTNLSNSQLRKKKSSSIKRTVSASKPYEYKPRKVNERYLIIDGYNIIFAWDELKDIAKSNIDGARDKLVDLISNYRGAKDTNVVIVFDAYKLKGFPGEELNINGIKIVYTKEDETADAYIERMAHSMGRKYDVKVATSDGLEQLTVLSQGCTILSAKELKSELQMTIHQIRERIEANVNHKNYLMDNIGDDVLDYINKLGDKEN
ncbi:MAG: NYN domain-containing protein [Lachnospiraceae bacterium]|nr:NYN domain-containing protein [Lachnospiraceae bacterium]